MTRSDVARYAGVSTAVVSFVVNGGPKTVSEATKQRVLDAVEHLGYRPNRTARALSMGSTKTLGLVVGDTTNPFFAEYTRELQQAAADLGYALLMTAGGPGPDAPLRSMLDLCDRQIDGLIVARATAMGRLEELRRRSANQPVVVIDAAAAVPGYATVGPDAAEGMAMAVGHLLSVHHHQSVALVIGDDVEPDTDGREAGWRQAHTDHGRQPGEVSRTAFTRDGGYRAGLDLLRGDDRPTAVVASSDLQAIGLLTAAGQLNLRVPEDVAVVSFDGTEETRFTAPPLTTVRQPVTTMAAAAIDLVVHPRPAAHETFPMELIVRRSCGCEPEVRLMAAPGVSLHTMTESPDDRLIEGREQLLPEELAAGSDDPEAQARAILEESEERTLHPEKTRRESTQTPD
ncbi:MAG TPA: LacI family DNA-binding transcriptional regulator [Arachnia sp.]|nr:LacI family DNA-binding transcriptional regulator [Arachnia sp.]